MKKGEEWQQSDLGHCDPCQGSGLEAENSEQLSTWAGGEVPGQMHSLPLHLSCFRERREKTQEKGTKDKKAGWRQGLAEGPEQKR